MLTAKKNTNDISALLKYIKDSIELVYVDGYKKCCYPILASFIIDYKKPGLIIDIKTNKQYSICYI